MPFTAIAAQVSVMYRCSFCGHKGEEEVEGNELIDNSFGVFDFTCPKCGHDLTHCEYGEDIDDFEDDNCEEEDEDKDDE